jgi:hypothetical protein
MKIIAAIVTWVLVVIAMTTAEAVIQLTGWHMPTRNDRNSAL